MSFEEAFPGRFGSRYFADIEHRMALSQSFKRTSAEQLVYPEDLYAQLNY